MIIEISSPTIHVLKEFMKHDFLPTFRYFQGKTPEDVIKHHYKTILLLKDDTPIGYAHIDYDIVHDMYWVGCCVVLQYRNQRVGTTLLQKIIDYYHQSDIPTLHLTVDKQNEHAIKLYVKYGFQIIRSTDTIHIMSLTKSNVINVPVSFGEAIDKLTILDIKLNKITDTRRNDVEKEYNALQYHLSPILTTSVSRYADMLRQINLQIWNDQDVFRYSSNEDEKNKLCKKIIEDNDARYRIKHKINHILSSMLKEQKGYNPTLYSIYYDDVEHELYLDMIIMYQSIFNDIIQVYCTTSVEEALRSKFMSDPSIIILPQESIHVPLNYIQTLKNDIKNEAFFNTVCAFAPIIVGKNNI